VICDHVIKCYLLQVVDMTKDQNEVRMPHHFYVMVICWAICVCSTIGPPLSEHLCVCHLNQKSAQMHTVTEFVSDK